MKSDGLAGILRPLWRRVLSVVARGLVTRVDDDGDLQRVQVRILSGEVRDEIDVLGHYGLASRPEAGAEAVLVFLGGNRDNGVAVSVDDRRVRPKNLDPGEVWLVNRFGSSVRLKPNGDVEVHAGSGEVRVFGSVGADGSVHADGDVSDGATTPGATLAQMRQIFNAHVHVQNPGSGPTDPPLPPTM